MGTLSQKEWIKWKAKRKHSLIGFIIVGMIIGLDYSFVLTTLYLYLRDMVKVDKPDLFYGLIIAIYFFASSVFGVIFGRLVDKYRRMVLFTNIVLVSQIIGVLLYIIPVHVAFPIIGRLICGIGDPYVSVCSGELVRIYNEEDGTSALWWLAAFCSFGFMIGPLLVFFVKNVEFNIGILHFNQLNGAGILLVGLLFISLIVANCLIHDCSAVFDLKMYLKENDLLDIPQENHGKMPPECNEHISETKLSPEPSTDKIYHNYRKHSDVSSDEERDRDNSERYLFISMDEDDCAQNNECNQTGPVSNGSSVSRETESITSIIYTLFTNVDALLIYVATFVLVNCIFSNDIVVPLLSGEILGWSLTTLNIIFVANGIGFFLFLVICYKYFLTDRTVYFLTISSVVSLSMNFVLLPFLNYFRHTPTVPAILMVFFVIFWTFGCQVEDMLLRCMLAKMVPSSCQSFSEAMRNGISRLSMILAAVTVPMLIHNINVWCPVMLVINSALLIAFLRRRATLSAVKEIEFKTGHTSSSVMHK